MSHFFRFRIVFLQASMALFSAAICFGQNPPNRTYTPRISPASDEPQKAMKKFSIPDGLELELFAAEPMLANPVAFTIDHQGRFYVAETFRLHAGVTDMRNHKKWLDDDLACRTVEDRINAMRKNLKFDFSLYALATDRVQLLEDTDGDGKADKSTIFAEGFSKSEDGIGAGVLADRGNVYYTCIPDLWLLKDTDGDGKADEKKSLATGFGVHINFLGHDLHGLRKGPDGRIYFSIGDRGSHVKGIDGTEIDYPDAGAVFRCEPDGSHLEIFHRGLRNPQELVFDDYGNLFTGDNNSDAGDKARFVYCVEGGDSGWQIGWQWIEKPVARGPWNAEAMWYPQWKGQAAYILPPITNVTSGPSGLTYYPGTGMSDAYKGHFFLCDFRGAATTSIIHSFALQPKGATFEMIDHQDFVKGSLVTDVDFGVNGGIYFTDWVQGWEMPKKGRIYHLFNKQIDESPIVQETKKLLAEGMKNRTNDELAKLLAHTDQRVRLEAQWELADRNKTGQETFVNVATLNQNQLARLHAIWGDGQIIRRSNQLKSEGTEIAKLVSKKMATPRMWGMSALVSLLRDPDSEVRVQSAKTLGDCGGPEDLPALLPPLIKLIGDPQPRVRFAAAITIAKLGGEEAIDPLLQMLRENADADPYLRHAAVMGLVGINKPEILLVKANDDSSAVRMGILLALRRLQNPEIARFLKDRDPLLVVEAARAINDVPIEPAFPALAAMAENAEKLTALSDLNIDPNPLLLRILNANYRLGKTESARAITQIASISQAPENSRLEALVELRDWAHPSVRDRVIGVWRPQPRAAVLHEEDARDAIRPELVNLLKDSNGKIAQSAAQLAGQYQIAEAALALFDLVSNANQSAEARVAALHALGDLNDSRLAKAIFVAQNDEKPSLRTEGNAQLAKLDPAEAMRVLSTALATGSTLEKQGAVNALADIKSPQADELLASWLDKAIAHQAPPEIELELLQAAKSRSSEEFKKKLERYDASIPNDNPLHGWHESLAGGAASRGESIFFEKVEAQCQKCHTVKGKGGGEVGPDLSDIGARKSRDYILTSIVHPNQDIAQGFENVTITTDDGKEVTGRVVTEDAEKILLESPIDEPGEEFVEEDATLPVKAASNRAATVRERQNQPSPDSKKTESAAKVKERQKSAPSNSTKSQTASTTSEAKPPKLIQITIEKSKIKSRQHNLSSMPDDISENLTKSDLRDLVEYLSNLK